MHSSLVLTTGGILLDLAAVKFWISKKYTGANALRGEGQRHPPLLRVEGLSCG